MANRYDILMRFQNKITVIEEGIDGKQIDGLVKSLNLLSDSGEVYYKRLSANVKQDLQVSPKSGHNNDGALLLRKI